MSKLSIVGQACCPNYSEGWGKDHLNLSVQDQLGQYGKILRKRGGSKERREQRGEEGKKERKQTKKQRLSQQQRGAGSCFLTWQDLVFSFSHDLPKADDRGTSLLARFNEVGCLPTYRQSLCSHPRTLSSWKRWRGHKTQKVQKSVHM